MNPPAEWNTSLSNWLNEPLCRKKSVEKYIWWEDCSEEAHLIPSSRKQRVVARLWGRAKLRARCDIREEKELEIGGLILLTTGCLWILKSSNPTSGNTSEGIPNTNLKEHKHPYVHGSVIYNRQDMKAAQVSTSRWVDKTTTGHLHNGVLLGHKKEENFTFYDSKDGRGKHYAKWNKPVRERQVPHDLTHMWNLRNELN